MRRILQNNRLLLALFALCALGGAIWPIRFRSGELLLMGWIGLALGAALALVTLGVLRLFDRLANHIIVLVASIILGACGVLLAAVALTYAGATAADAPAAVNTYELGVGVAFISILFWRAAARHRATVAGLTVQERAQWRGSRSQEPWPDKGKRVALGAALSTLVSYGIALIPVGLELLATRSSDREWFALGLLALFGLTIPVAAVVAAAFVPAFLAFEWRGWRSPLPYIVWGSVVLLVVLYVLSRSRTITPGAETLGMLQVGSFAVGALLGLAFWVGAVPFANKLLVRG